MSKKSANLVGLLFLAWVGIIGLYASNPNVEHFRKIMQYPLDKAEHTSAFLPVKRTDYTLFSKFDVKSNVLKTTCYGAASYLFYCQGGKEG